MPSIAPTLRALAAWPAALRVALRALRRGPGAHVRRLIELRRGGAMRVMSAADDGAPLLMTLVFADGDLLIKATSAGLARWDEHRRELDGALADLRATPAVLRALVPLVLLPGLIWLTFDLVHAGERATLARDLLLIALPWLGLALFRWALGRWIRRRLAAELGL